MSHCTLFAFLNAARGNWRNSIFIECRTCPYGRLEPCVGFLLAPDSEGRPVLLPADVIYKLTGVSADKSECQAILSRQCFETLFSLWLDWQTNLPRSCALLQIVGKMCNEPVCQDSQLN